MSVNGSVLSEELTARIAAARVIPVVDLPDAGRAVPLARSILGGGLDCVEVTFRTPAAREGLTLIRKRFPEILLIAGTVRFPKQVDVALECGADLIVSPGLVPAVVDHCSELGIPVLPGVCTPTEIDAAYAKGVDTVKFFPAESMGGAATLRALCGPYRETRFVPTGGVNADNLRSYLTNPQVLACAGTWMATVELITSGQFEEIRRRVAQAVDQAGEAGR